MQSREKLAGFDCRIEDELGDGKLPRILVVLFHGFGAPGADLVPIGSELLRASPALRQHARFVFPAAPILMGGYGDFDSRAWWEIDVERLERSVSSGQADEGRRELPPELPELRRELLDLIDLLRARAGLPLSRVVLGGFSQGAMLATDLTLLLPENPGGLAIFSGTILHDSGWEEAAPRRAGLQVVQSHGTQDPLLSFRIAEDLRDLLKNAGLDVTWLPFRGQHTIPFEALAALRQLLEGLAAS